MKLNDIKHNHSLTDLLKILIFAILMMIPFIDVGVRCAYVICNKNAYQSYSNKYIKNTEIVQTALSEGLTYLAAPSNRENPTNGPKTYYSSISINWTDYGAAAHDYTAFYIYGNGSFLLYYDNNGVEGNVGLNNSLWNTIDNFTFVSTGNNNVNVNSYLNYYLVSYKTESLDNVFDYSVNKLTTSELYTWTQNTAIYTGVQTMSTQLGINNTVIPILLVYWFILTVIYIIIDIVLKLFTMLTHAIGSKTA